MNRLTLSYNSEDSWHGELTAKVSSEGFCGQSAAWFGIEQLRAFGETLKAYPILTGQEPSLGGGFWKDDQLDQTHVSIRIEPTGPRGNLHVRVILATPAWDLGRSDRHSVEAQFLINYAELDDFQRQFSALLTGETVEACLKTTPT